MLMCVIHFVEFVTKNTFLQESIYSNYDINVKIFNFQKKSGSKINRKIENYKSEK